MIAWKKYFKMNSCSVFTSDTALGLGNTTIWTSGLRYWLRYWALGPHPPPSALGASASRRGLLPLRGSMAPPGRSGPSGVGLRVRPSGPIPGQYLGPRSISAVFPRPRAVSYVSAYLRSVACGVFTIFSFHYTHYDNI